MKQRTLNYSKIYSKLTNTWLTSGLGAIVFSLLSMLQKFFLGLSIFDLTGYIVPLCIGTCFGCILGIIFSRTQTHFDKILEVQNNAIQELVHSEERFRMLAENARDVIFRWLLKEHRYQYVSPAVYTLTGYPPQQFLDNPHLLQEIIFPEDRQILQEMNRKILHGDVPPHIEYRVNHKQGHVVWVNQRHAFTFDDQGNSVSLEGICTDITEYRAVRQQKRDMENQLYQSQKMEAIGRLAGGLAHDFNNLLTVINGYSELLLADSHDKDNQPFEILEIHKAGQKAADLISQLLAFSRKQIAIPHLIDPADRIRESSRMLQRMIGEDIQLEQIIEDNVPNILMDSIQLDQVLMNLVVNSREAMPDGGTISIHLRQVNKASFTCSMCQEQLTGNLVFLEVKDIGCGMTQDIIERIFEPFFTTKEIHQGTGLGLSTVYGIIHQNNGHIEVKSQPGEGTCFTLVFQGVESENKAEYQQHSSLQSPRLKGTESILVVEDEPLVRSLAATVLTQYGYQVMIAAEGNEALDIFRVHKKDIDLVLTDVVMPGMSGVELTKQLTSNKPDLKIIFMSGYIDKKLDVSGITHSTHVFLKKPFGSEALVRVVRQTLDGVPH